MKKHFFLLGFAFTVIFMSSCKRQYICKCHYEEAHEDHTHDEYVSYPLGELSKRSAKSECENKETALIANPEHSDVHCELQK